VNRESLIKIGSLIKERRESLGISIFDVSNILKINPTYIEAIEKGDIDRFPAEVYYKGFLKNYAKYLEVDISGMLQELKIKEESTIRTIEKKKTNKKWHFGYIFVACVALFIIFSWARIEYIKMKSKSEFEKRQNTSFKTMTTAKELALHEQKKQILGMKEKSSKNLIIIKTKDDCWIEVKDGENKIFQGLLVSGEKREIDYKKGLRLKVGNAEAVEIEINGKKMDKLGSKGEVKELVIE
jgi:cytoskeleton protein RodZ